MPKGKGPFPGLIICQSFLESLIDHVKIGEVFADNGIATILFDYTNSSLESWSDGSAHKLTILSQSSDIQAVINEVLRNEEINHAFLLGLDEGAFAAAMAGQKMKDDVDAMILFYPAFNLPGEVRNFFKDKDKIEKNCLLFNYTLSPEFYKILYDLHWEQAIEGYKKPVLVFHGSKDPIVPVEYAREAIVVYPKGQIVELKNETHSFKEETFQESLKISIQFIDICNSLENFLELHIKRKKKN